MTPRKSRPGFDQKMTAEEINSRPIVAYEGPVHVVRTAAGLAAAVRDLRSETVLGFDTETKPSFAKGESNPLSLVQFAGSRAVYIIQLQHVRSCAALDSIISSERIVKAGIDITQDLSKLKQRVTCDYAGFIDITRVARECGIKNFSLRGLAAVLLGVRVAKGMRVSNWGRDTLLPSQIKYAATDAWISRELYLKLIAEKTALESVQAAALPTA